MKIKLVAVSLLLAGFSNAATLNTTNLPTDPAATRIIVDSTNSVLSTGYAAIGYFSSLTSGSFSTSTGLDLENDFNVLGSATDTFTIDFNNSGLLIPGGLQFTSSATTSSGIGGINTDFINKIAYLVIANASTLSSATEALIYNTDISIPEDPSNPIPVDVSAPVLAGTIEFGSGDGVADVFLDVNNLGQINNALKTATLVPEPSTLLLSALGCFALLRRKR